MNPGHMNLIPALVPLERKMILDALRDSKGNLRKAARALQISRWALCRRIKRHGIDVPMLKEAVWSGVPLSSESPSDGVVLPPPTASET